MNDKVCLAYICINSLSDNNGNIMQKTDFKKLTHICIAFAQIKQINGKWLPYIAEDAGEKIAKLKAEINNQKAGTKILLSVGGASQDGFCQASRTPENRKLFSEKLGKIVNDLHLDGIDIDWEFPGESSLGIASCKNCKKDYILLLKAIRKQLKDKLLTVAVGSNKFIGVDVKALAKIVDFVLVMTYDLGISHSNTYLAKLFINMWMLHGVPNNKLCVGVPFYGRNVKNIEESISYCEAINGNISHIAGQSFSHYKGKKWCFDTESDIKEKAQWAVKKKLAGIFCWEISTDVNNRLISAMYSNIK